jgi:hypothetical protein
VFLILSLMYHAPQDEHRHNTHCRRDETEAL